MPPHSISRVWGAETLCQHLGSQKSRLVLPHRKGAFQAAAHPRHVAEVQGRLKPRDYILRSRFARCLKYFQGLKTAYPTGC